MYAHVRSFDFFESALLYNLVVGVELVFVRFVE